MPPLIVHCLPGPAVEEARLAPDVERERPVELAVGVERRRRGLSVARRIEVDAARRRRQVLARPSGLSASAGVGVLDGELDRLGRHREADVVAAAGGEDERSCSRAAAAR